MILDAIWKGQRPKWTFMGATITSMIFVGLVSYNGIGFTRYQNIVLSVPFVNNAGSVCYKMCFIYLTWQEMLNAKVHKKAFFCIPVKGKELTEQGILAGIYVEADPVSWEVADGFLLSPIF